MFLKILYNYRIVCVISVANVPNVRKQAVASDRSGNRNACMRRVVPVGDEVQRLAAFIGLKEYDGS